jgi:hypothetical protein
VRPSLPGKALPAPGTPASARRDPGNTVRQGLRLDEQARPGATLALVVDDEPLPGATLGLLACLQCWRHPSHRARSKLDRLARYPNHPPGWAVVTHFRMVPVEVRLGSFRR